jgi:hypothetical protein
MDILKTTAAARLLVLGPAMLLFAGCSNSEAPYVPELVPVTGTLTYKGQAVTGAIVAFHPAEAIDFAEAAFAETDSQGRFSLLMQDFGRGAIPGDHVVTIMCPTGGIPEKYKTKQSTPLRATVEVKVQNEIPLVLED